MLLRGVIRTMKCYVESCTQEDLREDSLNLPWLVEHAGSILQRGQKGRDGRTPLERLCGKALTQKFVLFEEKVLARPIFLRTVKQNESQIQVRSVAGSEKRTVPSAPWRRQKLDSRRERSGG